MFIDGVWHSAQPVSVNTLAPVVIDAAVAPLTLSDGFGGARKRMKTVNFSIALSPSTVRNAEAGLVGGGSKLASLLGDTASSLQPGLSSRSVGKARFEIPISTL